MQMIIKELTFAECTRHHWRMCCFVYPAHLFAKLMDKLAECLGFEFVDADDEERNAARVHGFYKEIERKHQKAAHDAKNLKHPNVERFTSAKGTMHLRSPAKWLPLGYEWIEKDRHQEQNAKFRRRYNYGERSVLSQVLADALECLVVRHNLQIVPFSIFEFIFADACYRLRKAAMVDEGQRRLLVNFIQNHPSGIEEGISEIYYARTGTPPLTTGVRSDRSRMLRQAARYFARPKVDTTEAAVEAMITSAVVPNDMLEEFHSKPDLKRSATSYEPTANKDGKLTMDRREVERSVENTLSHGLTVGELERYVVHLQCENPEEVRMAIHVFESEVAQIDQSWRDTVQTTDAITQTYMYVDAESQAHGQESVGVSVDASVLRQLRADTAGTIKSTPQVKDAIEDNNWPNQRGKVPIKDVLRSAADYWIVDNSRLRARTPGLGLRKSTIMKDKDGESFVQWGAVIKARLHDQEWLETRREEGLRYLPRFADNIVVMRPYMAHDIINSMREETAVAEREQQVLKEELKQLASKSSK
jgi:hypothetical protein